MNIFENLFNEHQGMSLERTFFENLSVGTKELDGYWNEHFRKSFQMALMSLERIFSETLSMGIGMNIFESSFSRHEIKYLESTFFEPLSSGN